MVGQNTVNGEPFYLPGAGIIPAVTITNSIHISECGKKKEFIYSIKVDKRSKGLPRKETYR